MTVVYLSSEVGEGPSTMFWMDHLIHGQKISDLALQVFILVPKKKAIRRVVHDALTNNLWVSDIQGA